MKKEVEMVKAEKTRHVGEVTGLRVACADFENLQGKVESVGKHLDGAKVAEQLATECAPEGQ